MGFLCEKIAPTNQGDNGRDLICEYNMLYDVDGISRGEESFKIGKMIIQCKTNLKTSKKSSIGKADVDVANTIFDYRPDGYMLVVNTQITRDLTEMLEPGKKRGKSSIQSVGGTHSISKIDYVNIRISWLDIDI